MNTNLIHIYNTTQNQILWCTDEYYNAFDLTMQKYLKDGFDFSGMSSAQPLPYVKVGDIAIVDFSGFTVNNCSDDAADCLGLCSLQTFCNNLEQAVSDDSVSKVVINFDSGGGQDSYGDETCALVKELSEIKPIYAYTSTFMCSMAYAVAVNCTELVGSPSAFIGSIGCMVTNITLNATYTSNYSGSMTMAITPDKIIKTFQGGALKTVGSSKVPLTPEQEQSIVDNMKQELASFQTLVTDNRGDVDEADMQGQSFRVKDAMEQDTNLMDGMENSLNDFIQTLLLQ
jgi:ClpP class serine protease